MMMLDRVFEDYKNMLQLDLSRSYFYQHPIKFLWWHNYLNKKKRIVQKWKKAYDGCVLHDIARMTSYSTKYKTIRKYKKYNVKKLRALEKKFWK